jgi:hypothetical protein
MDDDRDLEKIYRSAVSGLYARLRSNYDFIFREYGDDGLKLIARMSREYGLSVAARAKGQLQGSGLDEVTDYLMRIFRTVGWGKKLTEISEKTPSMAVIKVYECPLHFDNPGMCLAHTVMEKTVVEELNPDLRYRIGKSIPAGDDYCEHILELSSKTK